MDRGGTAPQSRSQSAAAFGRCASREGAAALKLRGHGQVTKACIVQDAKSMVGTVAKDESALTKLSCRKSTVKRPTQGVYTVHCTATYSDGAVCAGIASVLISQGKVTWEPTASSATGRDARQGYESARSLRAPADRG